MGACTQVYPASCVDSLFPIMTLIGPSCTTSDVDFSRRPCRCPLCDLFWRLQPMPQIPKVRARELYSLPTTETSLGAHAVTTVSVISKPEMCGFFMLSCELHVRNYLLLHDDVSIAFRQARTRQPVLEKG